MSDNEEEDNSDQTQIEVGGLGSLVADKEEHTSLSTCTPCSAGINYQYTVQSSLTRHKGDLGTSPDTQDTFHLQYTSS